MPDAVASNVEKLAAMGVPVVVGTRDGSTEMDRVRAAVEKHGTGLVWSPNFSIGVNVFSRLVREAARLLADEPQYGAWAWEIHHHTKKDAPSGTLLKLVEEMKRGGYKRAHRRELQSRGRASGDARNRVRFGGGHDHAAAHGAQPRRIRARGAEGRAMDCRAKRACSSLAKFYLRGRCMFTGCGTALVTPFRRICRSTRAALRKLVRRQIEAGINFLVPCGTTGESPTLTRAEHLRVVEITLEEAKGKVPVLAGAGGYNTAEVIELAQRAAAHWASTAFFP